jgi:hypothetical protein
MARADAVGTIALSESNRRTRPFVSDGHQRLRCLVAGFRREQCSQPIAPEHWLSGEAAAFCVPIELEISVELRIVVAGSPATSFVRRRSFADDGLASAAHVLPVRVLLVLDVRSRHGG